MIGVLIVDDHAVVRHGLAQLLAVAQDVDVLGAADGCETAIEIALRSPPDVVLMDISMPGKDGIATTKELLHRVPTARVVMLTSFSDRERILAALDAGAIGYLLKDAEPDELLSGIRAAARGESPLHPRAAHELLSNRASRADALEQLTVREREVLTLLSRGCQTS
jgi:DNA-binding NarL/FixJ family response regulator